MRVLVFHGYLLHGTGSNVYNAKLAEALVRAGHEVHLLCQDREPWTLDWVDAWEADGRAQVRRDPPRATVYRPDIGGLLPVYVPDRYEGVDARPFYELSGDEVDAYVERNVAAVRAVAERVRPDVALANHLVMGPVILARALAGAVPYAVKIHGSALEYVVKPHLRFLPYAREGLAGASAVLVGSRHTGESLWAAMGDESVRERTRLGPPGVDVEEFRPRDAEAARTGFEGLRARIDVQRSAPASPAGGAPAAGAPASPAGAPPARAPSSFTRDSSEAAAALGRLDPERDRLVVFVGKLIGSKGAELLLAAWPLVFVRQPRARLVIVGFGGLRERLESFAALLRDGEVEAAADLRAEDGRRLPELDAFFDDLPPGYAIDAREAMRTVSFTGRLDHSELADLLPASEAIVVPSTFPEAFGMVAAEGAACGALPIVARHSGLAEVSEALAAVVPAPARAWLSFEVGESSVLQLAACLQGWLGADDALRAATRGAIVAVTRERWSWEGVARTVIAAARGELADLPRP